MNAEFHSSVETNAENNVLDTLGRPLHDLRISVIDACNFRCPYCMPADKTPDDIGLNNADRMSFDEIEVMARAFARVGVRKIRITGGEPLLRKNLPDLITRLACIEGIEDLAMTTNGSLLTAQTAQALKAAGLNRITVSLDALDANVFRQMSGGRGDIRQVLAGIAAADHVGFRSLKINTVIQRGVNEDQMLPLVDYFRHTPYVLRFIEYMDVGSCNAWRKEDVVPSHELYQRIHAHWPLQTLEANYRGEVAERYEFLDGGGEVGFVSSVSAPFCGDCHRARLSVDGKLYRCLFASHGHDLRAALMHGELALTKAISSVWLQRQDQYSQQRHEMKHRDNKKIEMYFIGG
jgi:GTP 3',8-cyclase